MNTQKELPEALMSVLASRDIDVCAMCSRLLLSDISKSLVHLILAQIDSVVCDVCVGSKSLLSICILAKSLSKHQNIPMGPPCFF